jgi:biopolymer transport protein ExbD
MAGGAAYQDEDAGGTIADINVTPLVDIVLVLLIVFMITVPSIVNNPSIKVELPKAASGDDTLKSTLALTLQRKPDGSAGYNLYANGELTDELKVRTMIPDLLAKNKDLQTIIAADKGIAYGDVVHIVDLVKTLGVHKFALNTDATQ